MNIKCTILKLLGSMVVSPIIIYAILIIAEIAGASYDMSHGEAFIVWLLTAILVSQSWTWKK